MPSPELHRRSSLALQEVKDQRAAKKLAHLAHDRRPTPKEIGILDISFPAESIAYLDVRSLVPLHEERGGFGAAISKVQRAKAVILDLRKSRKGTHASAAKFASYFQRGPAMTFSELTDAASALETALGKVSP